MQFLFITLLEYSFIKKNNYFK